MRSYEVEQRLFGGGWLLREPDERLVEQIRTLLDLVEREQVGLSSWLQTIFAPWLVRTRRWIDDPASAGDHERLREVLERLRAFRTLIAYVVRRSDKGG